VFANRVEVGMPLGSRVGAAVTGLAIAVTVVACGGARQPPLTGSEPREFTGTWNAVGSRKTIQLGEGRTSSVLELEGPVLLAGPQRPGVGFQSHTIALSDSTTGLLGRSEWTDENGDKVFSEITGTGTAAQNKLQGRIVGGTGRYSGVTGTYDFSWSYLIETDDGTVQGRAVGLTGQVTKQPSGGGGDR
jgi:hypothetical protein